MDYGETTCWYSLHPEGSGGPLPTLADRLKPLAHSNPQEATQLAGEDRQLLLRLVGAPAAAGSAPGSVQQRQAHLSARHETTDPLGGRNG